MDNGRTYKSQRYDDIIEEQVLIGYMSKGAIGLSDTDLISPHDRKAVLKSIIKIREQEAAAQEEALRG